MADPYVGEIRVFPFLFAPQGWMECNGQILNVNQYQLLFAVIGGVYGGNFPQTFALPNLMGAAPIGMGTGSDGIQYNLGTVSGLAEVTLTQPQMPTHTHSLTAKKGNTVAGGESILVANPQGADLTVASTSSNAGGTYSGLDGYSPSTNTSLLPLSLSNTGTGGPHSNRQPYQVFRFCIAWEGVFPVRD